MTRTAPAVCQSRSAEQSRCEVLSSAPRPFRMTKRLCCTTMIPGLSKSNWADRCREKITDHSPCSHLQHSTLSWRAIRVAATQPRGMHPPCAESRSSKCSPVWTIHMHHKLATCCPTLLSHTDNACCNNSGCALRPVTFNTASLPAACSMLYCNRTKSPPAPLPQAKQKPPCGPSANTCAQLCMWAQAVQKQKDSAANHESSTSGV